MTVSQFTTPNQTKRKQETQLSLTNRATRLVDLGPKARASESEREMHRASEIFFLALAQAKNFMFLSKHCNAVV